MTSDSSRRLGLPEWLITACGFWHIGLGLYFLLARPALLPEDIRYINSDAALLLATVPKLAAWLDKVFAVMGGFMAGAGVLIVFIGIRVMPRNLPGSLVALALYGATTLVLMSAVNFALHSDFRWLLAIPPVAWFPAPALYYRKLA